MREELLASASRTVDGDTGGVVGFGPAYSGVLQVNVTALTGTSPTLTVVFEDSCDGVNWSEVATTAALNATGTTALRIEAPFSDLCRVRWTLGGTSPDATFDVWAFFKTHGAPES